MPRTQTCSRRSLRALALLVALSTTAFSAQDATLSPDLLEVPRLGIAFKGAASAVKARIGWRELVAGHDCAPDLVVLDALPASVAKAKTPPPRWVVVYEEAKSAATGAATEEYEDDLGRSFRIRYRGATAQGRAKIYELRDKPVEIAELVDAIDDTKPPDKSRFADGETKKEIVVDPEELLDRMLARMAGRALALASAIDLWRERATLVERTAGLEPAASAAFWRRASAVTLDPWYGTTPVPWHSLETAALALWQRAPAAAERFRRPATTCAWCDLAPPAADATCACPESNALAHARHVLSSSFGRKDQDETRKAALAEEVAFEDLDASRAAKWKPAVAALGKRLKAEQLADEKRLAARLELGTKHAWGKQTYVILVLQQAPVEWRPSDPDLVRHASELVQAFTIGSNIGGTFFGVDAARPTISLSRWNQKTKWYEAVGRREYKGGTEAIDAMLLRALWDNARGVDSEPAPR